MTRALHFRRVVVSLAACLALCPSGASPALAAEEAFDEAADPAYDFVWQTGTNGGFGFTQWVMNVGSNTGSFVGSAPEIDTNGRSWGLHTEGEGSTITAQRNFDGPLEAGDTFRVDIARDPRGGEPGVQLTDGPEVRLWFFYDTFAEQWTVRDLAGFHRLGPVNPQGAVRVDISLTGPDLYELTMRLSGGGASSVSGALSDGGDLKFLILRASGQEAERREQFFNTLSVPEPGAVARLVGVVFALAALTRVAPRVDPRRTSRRLRKRESAAPTPGLLLLKARSASQAL